MPELGFVVHALGPMLFRDGRPFGSEADEARAQSLPIPTPATVAGLFRTTIGNLAGLDWSQPAGVALAQRITLGRTRFDVSPLTGGDTSAVRAPLSAPVLDTGEDPVLEDLVPQPLPVGARTSLPAGLLPLLSTRQGKPARGYEWWSGRSLEQWLCGELPGVPESLAPPLSEECVQIATVGGSKVAEKGMLYTIDYRLWESRDENKPLSRWTLRARVQVPDELVREHPLPEEGTRVDAYLGGERRPVVIEVAEKKPWGPGEHLVEAVSASTRIKLYLETPALFTGGWRPGWCDHPETLHPALAGAMLVGAAVGRQVPVSGWSYERTTWGKKPIRWAAPAGSTYFFELPAPLGAEEITKMWDTPVCDSGLSLGAGNDGNGSGFGQAMWGVWKA